jgi:hypothetical protein
MPLVKKKEIKNQYRIPPPVELDTSDLWGRPEYEAYNYADIILSIVEYGETSVQKIKEILTKHRIPCDTGQIFYGLNLLKGKVNVSKTFQISLTK